jgi:hypothetical protein
MKLLGQASRALLIPLAVLMITSAAMIWWVTRHGIGFFFDSMAYVSAARHLLAKGTLLYFNENGGWWRLSHWPPLYPFALAVLSWPHGDPMQTARWLNIVLFPLNLLLLAILARKVAVSIGATVVILSLFALSTPIIAVHATAYSEPLCMTFWLWSMTLMLDYQITGAWKFLIGTALTAAAALLTRYAAIAQVMAGVCLVLAYTPGSYPRKLKAAIAYGLLSVGPLEFWILIHQRAHANLVADRIFQFYGFGIPQLEGIRNALMGWLIPLRPLPQIWSGWAVQMLATILGLMVAGLAIGLAKNTPALKPQDALSVPARKAIALLVANFAMYGVMLFTAGTFFDEGQDFGPRIQIFPFVFVLLWGGIAWTVWLRPRLAAAAPLLRCLGAGLLALVLGAYFCAAVAWLTTADDSYHGLGYNSAPWRLSPAIALIKQRYPNAPIYTHNVTEFYCQLGRTDVYVLDWPYNLVHQKPNPRFAQNTAASVEDMKAKNGVMVCYKPIEPALHMLTLAEIKKYYPGMQVVAETDDAYFLRPKQ